jgi:protocatechuate 3,4-dioxygenase beta subunit
MIKKLLIILPIFCCSLLAEAKDILNKCIPAKSYTNNYEPAAFNKTNNLLRKSGTDPLYCGEKILLEIEVVDKNCVPISDAKIYLWQVGCDKKYPYSPLKSVANKKMFNKAGGSTFLGSGIATTNNIGKVKFLTVIPPALGNEAANINIRIEHKDLGAFQTKIFVKNYDIESGDDYEIIRLRITTPWENLFRRY